jgi:hypothetical protein
MPKCGHVTLTPEQTTLPGRTEQWGPWDSVPNIAVVTGAWDRMEKVLDKLGVEEKTAYNGKDYGTGPKSIQNLLQNGALLKSHHIVLINCGTKFESLVTSPGPARNNLRAYVKQGGRLFVTDLSYDFVEQTFPEQIDFEGSESTPIAEPEDPDAAEIGSENLVLNADVKDPDLETWLGNPPISALLPSGKVKIEGFLTRWAVQKEPNPDLATKVWVSSPVTWAGGSGTRALTTSFEYFGADRKGCGRVVFSSYHTFGDAAELLPQERILEYLMLEIGTCIELE